MSNTRKLSYPCEGMDPSCQLEAHAGELRMSTVNLTECLIRLRDRQPHLAPVLEEQLLESACAFP